MMRVLGIDPSLSSTGWALVSRADDGHVTWSCGTVKTKPVRNRMSTLVRFDDIAYGICSTVAAIAPVEQVDLVIMEGPAFSRSNGMAHERAGLWWNLFDYFARERRVQTEVIGPTLRAKYATGKGNAGKDEVMLAVSRRYPSAPVTNNNEADAVILTAMGARWLGSPVDDPLPQTHVAAMKTLVAMVDLSNPPERI